MELALAEERREAEAALKYWKGRLHQLGYAGLRTTYFDKPVEEFFDFKGSRYFVVTEAWWDGRAGGDLRVFIELSDALDDAPTVSLEEYMIVAPDGSLLRE
jgi:hypothetical protein